ncbi:MAG: FtsQ-type POTRA domain-containing protein [Candidatus Aminicenantes bacterium]|nr:MAG: FtsQ-type POTRA domain-containing protein [Candidatus Aminicenantes bacterium]
MSQLTGAPTILRGETEFLRKHNSKILQKQKRLRTIQVKSLHIFLIFLLLGMAAFAAYKIGVFILTWEKLDIRRFVLINKPTYRTDELEHMLRQYHGNILTLRFSELRQKLLTLKEVKDVSISRQLPSTIEIRFILRKPVFQVAINNKYNIMDSEGVVLYTSNKSSKELINIRDIKKSDLEALTPYLSELSRIRDFLDYVTLKKPYGVTLKLKGRREIFYPGETEFANKINLYLKLSRRPLLKKYSIKSVDLRFSDRFYFEYHTEVSN